MRCQATQVSLERKNIVLDLNLNRVSKQGSEHTPSILIPCYLRLHCLLGFEKQRASVVDTEMLEAVRVGVHENLFCAIE